ncbi:MAG: hypothetical protein PT944_01595 [Actinomycetaceae bacterium]|nr:hypothetical protein [Arcanobacterium sp.]MDD7686597.1 hypothetical protein [Actinomycetaceae bacterium]MDY5273103.1 hypothetical protein [Arcanobacterium sp.]
MNVTRLACAIAALALTATGLAGCGSTTPQRLCSHPLASAFATLEAGKQADTAISVSAPDLAICTAEALGQLKGYQEETMKNGKIHSHSRVNINPLKVDMVIDEPLSGQFEQVILIEGFAFAKVNGTWIQATEDADDPAIRSLLNLPQSFQTQFNPRLRAAGTDSSIRYTVVGTDTVLGQPVIVMEATIANKAESYTSRYYLNKNYVLLRSDAVSSAGTTTTSRLTEIDVPQTITNPLLPAKS